MSWTKWNGKTLKAKVTSSVAQAVYDTANEVGAESLQQVPHDEGWLEESLTIMKDPTNPTHTYIGYGGGGVSGVPKVPYAIKWHETPANFQKGRKHNYLRDPINQVAPRALMNNLKQVIR